VDIGGMLWRTGIMSRFIGDIRASFFCLYSCAVSEANGFICVNMFFGMELSTFYSVTKNDISSQSPRSLGRPNLE